MNLLSLSKFSWKPENKVISWWIISCLFLFGLFAPTTFASGDVKTIAIGKRPVDYAPVRGKFRPLRLRRDGFFQYSCNECHRVFDTVEGKKSRIAEHVNLKLSHGRDVDCLNCHHKTNRDAYIALDGREISSDRPEELCSQCHGLIYRDWKAGAHGRTGGSWNRSEKEWYSLVCTECHDPHHPKFPELVPMPGPAIQGKKTEKDVR